MIQIICNIMAHPIVNERILIDYPPTKAFNFYDATDEEDAKIETRPIPRDWEVIGVLKTVHSYQYQGILRLYVPEVRQQIPEKLRKRAVAFRTFYPANINDWDQEALDYLNKGWHQITVVVYGEATAPFLY
jgi:hypothetical protein